MEASKFNVQCQVHTCKHVHWNYKTEHYTGYRYFSPCQQCYKITNSSCTNKITCNITQDHMLKMTSLSVFIGHATCIYSHGASKTLVHYLPNHKYLIHTESPSLPCSANTPPWLPIIICSVAAYGSACLLQYIIAHVSLLLFNYFGSIVTLMRAHIHNRQQEWLHLHLLCATHLKQTTVRIHTCVYIECVFYSGDRTSVEIDERICPWR